MNRFKQTVGCLTFAFVASSFAVARADVFNMPSGQTSLQFVTVGDPGNAADTAVMTVDGTTGYGSVPYVYQMGKYDVTVGQYCQFLNAVAKTDNYGLYDSNMATSYPTISIAQNDVGGTFSYAVTGSYNQAANCPMFFVTWGDAARFCNWLQNGQPTGPEGNGTTETGAYTLNGATSDSAMIAITRNAGATYFIPSENEWYKAAYYKGGSTNAGYWAYPTQSNTAPSNVLSAIGTNNANYNFSDPTNCLTPVGAFADSPGPYGTYDMGGDVYQWNEAVIQHDHLFRGGRWNKDSGRLGASFRDGAGPPTYGSDYTGFRVASSEAAPEPDTVAMLLAGAVTLLAYAWRRRAKAA
jgi:formylglycine-generating enzyme required for sulfatase activity